MKKGEYKIEKVRVNVPFIDCEGNLNNHIINRDVLRIGKYSISKSYYAIKDLGNDHFAVCNLVNTSFIDNYDFYNYIYDNSELNLGFKWGIIRLSRNVVGKILPLLETLVVPCIYDKISGNNLKTATVYSNGKLTYIDLDKNSEYYGQQLVPCVLEHAVPFSTEYEGFAECSIDKVVGYIPRNCIPRTNLIKDDIITKSQMFYLYPYLNGEKGFKIGGKIVDKYFDLTGESLTEENCKKLRKIYDINN